MIKRLRRKFILINMVFVVAILLIVFISVTISTANRLDQDVKASLEQSLNFNVRGMREPEPKKPESGPEGDDIIRFLPAYTVTVTSYGIETNMQDRVLLSDGELAGAVAEVMARLEAEGAYAGVIGAYQLQYLVQEDDGRTRIAFVDRGYFTRSMNSLLALSGVIGFFSIGGFFVLSLFLSRYAIRPVEQSWEQQKQFVADASHELKTPLTVIMANHDILLSNKNSTIAEQMKWIESTGAEAGHMRRLVEELLFLAKSDAARRPELHSVNLSETLQGVVLQFEAVAFERRVVIEEKIAPAVTVKGEPTQLKQLASILLDNACKYSAPASVIGVSLTRSPHHALISVKNTGEAIPEKDLPYIFDRFYRSDEARSANQGSYGLGLAIAQSIVKMHDGRISVTSGAGETCFTVSFRLG